MHNHPLRSFIMATGGTSFSALGLRCRAPRPPSKAPTAEQMMLLHNGRQTGRAKGAAHAHSRLCTAVGCYSNGRKRTIIDENRHRQGSLLWAGKQQRNTMCLLTHPPAHDKASDSGDHGDAAEWTTDGPEVCSCTGAQPAVHCVGLQKHWTTKDHQRRVLASRTIIVMNRRSETKHHVPLDTHSSLCQS